MHRFKSLMSSSTVTTFPGRDFKNLVSPRILVEAVTAHDSGITFGHSKIHFAYRGSALHSDCISSAPQDKRWPLA